MTLRSVLRRGAALGIGLFALLIMTTGCDSEDLGDSNADTPSVGDYVRQVSGMSTLNGSLQEAGLSGALENDGITLFAPVNESFEPLDDADLLADSNSDLLSDVLSYHVVPQEIKLQEGNNALGAGTTRTFETLEGDDITVRVTEEGATVNGHAISNLDADASNGVVHVTNTVLLEAVDAVDRAELTTQFRILKTLIDQEGLAGTLRGPGPNASEGLTVFAPSNDAFLSALDNNDNGQIDSGEIPSNAGDILQYHVLDDVFRVEDVPTSATDVPTLEGSTVTVQRFEREGQPDSVTVNGNPVTLPDADVENGVIHGVESVLMP